VAKKQIQFMCTAFRDGFQSVYGARVLTEDFMPAEYGEVLAAGRGEPTAELRSEMAVTHNMVDVPRPKTSNTPPTYAVPQPKLWDD